MAKRTALVSTLIFALGALSGFSTCQAAENPAATMELVKLINRDLSDVDRGLIAGLLDQGADIDAADASGSTLLWTASFRGKANIVRLLLSRGAQPDKSGKAGSTPLFIAVQEGHIEVVRTLLEKGADPDRVSESGATPLFTASYKGNISLVEILVSRGARVNLGRKDGATPLIIAGMQGHLGIVKALVAAGADVDQEARNGFNALMIASQNGHIGIVRLLVNKGARVDRIVDGDTALILARTYGHHEIVELLKAEEERRGLRSPDPGGLKAAARKKEIRAKWAAVKEGMTFEQVDKLLGLTGDDVHGKLTRRVFAGKLGVTTYSDDFCEFEFDPSGKLVKWKLYP